PRTRAWRTDRSTDAAAEMSVSLLARSGSSYDSRSITWHQWHHVAPMSRRIGRSNSLARRNASSPHGYQSTGWCAAPLRYVDVSFERRFPRFSVIRPAQGPRRLWLFGTGRIRRMRIGLRLVQAFRKLLAELRNLRG